ncbi:alpha/beta fold hydrolase [Planomicrobium sp. CPCC 101079]|uniref:alpha/beta fold hydrolase n=1 Tax=Planomicrobium sp. CPCC 101079 TaxID=2599618 RepID=UPI0011B5DD34|nr:alpha/beta hydrolase [Planomicrobium sp. CPCC 101079]TWT01462.1 alpha/beta hydrolase [Planomicrobium sp. CPCC 101079]
MPYATINDDLSIYYHIKGEGMPVVFVHPFVMGHNVFMHQEALAKHYKTIFYDLAGHGNSPKGNRPVTIALLAEHLKSLLDQLGIEKVVLCAYSHGGLIAQEFALRYPERTIAIILSGGYSELNNFSPIFFIKSVMYMAKSRQIPLAAKLQAKLNKYYPEDEEKVYELARKTDPQSAYEYCKNGLDYKSTYSLHRLKMPILLIYGTLEKPMHHYQIPFLKAAPQTEVAYIDKGTHQVPIGSYAEFNGAVHQYLKPINERFLMVESRNGGTP